MQIFRPCLLFPPATKVGVPLFMVWKEERSTGYRGFDSLGYLVSASLEKFMLLSVGVGVPGTNYRDVKFGEIFM